MNRKKIALLLLIPTCFDTVEHFCRNISNPMMPPSISQMMRSSIVIFAAILGVIFLKIKLYKHHYVSIVAVVIGLTLVALSTLLVGDSTA
jgi:drug/metabolite transporter (DMT)-like permease